MAPPRLRTTGLWWREEKLFQQNVHFLQNFSFLREGSKTVNCKKIAIVRSKSLCCRTVLDWNWKGHSVETMTVRLKRICWWNEFNRNRPDIWLKIENKNSFCWDTCRFTPMNNTLKWQKYFLWYVFKKSFQLLLFFTNTVVEFS